MSPSLTTHNAQFQINSWILFNIHWRKSKTDLIFLCISCIKETLATKKKTRGWVVGWVNLPNSTQTINLHWFDLGWQVVGSKIYPTGHQFEWKVLKSLAQRNRPKLPNLPFMCVCASFTESLFSIIFLQNFDISLLNLTTFPNICCHIIVSSFESSSSLISHSLLLVASRIVVEPQVASHIITTPLCKLQHHMRQIGK